MAEPKPMELKIMVVPNPFNLFFPLRKKNSTVKVIGRSSRDLMDDTKRVLVIKNIYIDNVSLYSIINSIIFLFTDIIHNIIF
jgi:hypothetical protein